MCVYEVILGIYSHIGSDSSEFISFLFNKSLALFLNSSFQVSLSWRQGIFFSSYLCFLKVKS